MHTLATAILLSTFLLAYPSLAATNYVPNELLVQFKPGTDASKIRLLNESLGVEVLKTLSGGQVNLVKIPRDKTLEEIRRVYLAAPEVESVGLNYKVVGQ